MLPRLGCVAVREKEEAIRVGEDGVVGLGLGLVEVRSGCLPCLVSAELN